jgi:ABC-type protease/lipase transport system fused ATPase/permease subunit
VFDPAASYRPACLVVSHRRAVLQRADLVLVMHDGKVTLG